VVVAEPDGFDMVLVEAGSFDMGSASGLSNEQPVHTVQLTRSFYVSKYEVTFDQYDEFCDATRKTRLDDSGWGRGDQPVNVTWYDATEYCNWLSERAELTPCYSGRRIATECDFSADGYRLPTEAEWEYAALGGPRSQGYVYAGSNDSDEAVWSEENAGGQPHPVGQKAPNELGLYDMSGNFWEWCWDWYDKDYYASSPPDDPRGPDAPTNRMSADKARRGGSWYHEVAFSRITSRSGDMAHYRSSATGFRLVRTA
jgi:formylglycine-generating enzyme required for sulfatase activity